MKKWVFLSFGFFIFWACTSQKVDPETLPKDITENPNNVFVQKELRSLLDEIHAEINKINCTNANDWKFAPIGSKPCGGPTHYISYPIIIEHEIIPKINNYTEKHIAYNKEYNLISDCALVPEPSGIECKNGEAVLVYSKPVIQ